MPVKSDINMVTKCDQVLVHIAYADIIIRPESLQRKNLITDNQGAQRYDCNEFLLYLIRL